MWSQTHISVVRPVLDLRSISWNINGFFLKKKTQQVNKLVDEWTSESLSALLSPQHLHLYPGFLLQGIHVVLDTYSLLLASSTYFCNLREC